MAADFSLAMLETARQWTKSIFKLDLYTYQIFIEV